MPAVPDPHALRRDRPSDRAWTRLEPRPADAPVPDWPLTPPSDREMELWTSEWRRPQATEWLKNGEAQAVALFVRLLARAEKPDAPVTLIKYLREFRAELGVSADGAARRRWLMPDADKHNGRPASVTSLPGGSRTRSSAKDEFAQVNTSRPRTGSRARWADKVIPAADDTPPF